LAGDTTALRLCMERLVPPRKDRLVTFALPPRSRTAADAAEAISAVLAAVADGVTTPSEAAAVTSLIEAQCRAAGRAPSPGGVGVHVSFVPADPGSGA
jgi:phytoene/squalene synthetase